VKFYSSDLHLIHSNSQESAGCCRSSQHYQLLEVKASRTWEWRAGKSCWSQEDL